MKKISSLLIATAVLGAMVAPMTTFAAEYESNGVIKFIPNEGTTNPVDPTNPTDPVVPVDPTDPEGPNPGTAGPLSIDFASSLDFGEAVITSTDEVYFAAAQQFSVIGEDGQPSTEVSEGPNYVQVTDNRGLETGWSLNVRQDGQFMTVDSDELTGAEITFNNGNIQTASNSGEPVAIPVITLNSDGTETEVMTASTGNGAGTYLNVWGTAETAAESIELSVPGATTKYAKEYTTQLTWILTDTPTN